MLKLSFYSVHYNKEINITLRQCVAVRHYSSQRMTPSKNIILFFTYLCTAASVLWVYQEPNLYAVQLNETEHHYYHHESIACLTMLAKNSAMISSLPKSDLGNLCDTILMHSGINPVTVISMCFTLLRMSLL